MSTPVGPILFAAIDVETNGLPDYKLPADHPSQPRLAALGIVMLEVKGGESPAFSVQAEHEFLVKPNGWKMTPGASAVNGLTDERLAADGLELSDVLSKYRTLIQAGYSIAAYGAQHDCKIMRGEFRRRGLDDLFEATRNVCLMRALAPLKVPKAGKPGGWPKLEDACRFFGIEPEKMGEHTALGGARRASAILQALAQRGINLDPEVHYAKNAPAKPGPGPAAQVKAEPAKAGDRKTVNGVELEHNGLQWLPVMNAKNYPKLFNADGSKKA